MFDDARRARFQELQATLHALTESLERATRSAERIVHDTERYYRLRCDAARRKEEAAQLIARVEALREVIGMRQRMLARLLARMRQLRGATRDRVH